MFIQKHIVLRLAFVFTSLTLFQFSSCTKNEEYSFKDIEPPESASGLGWGLISSSTSNSKIIAKWKPATSPDANHQLIQFYTDENCTAPTGNEIKLTKEIELYDFDTKESGPFSFNIKTVDNNNLSSTSRCSLAYKIFQAEAFSSNECAPSKSGKETNITLPLPPLNSSLPFLKYTKVYISNSESTISAINIDHSKNQFSFISTSNNNLSKQNIEERNFEVKYELNTGHITEANIIKVNIDAREPQFNIVIDDQFKNALFGNNCTATETDCKTQIPVKIEHNASQFAQGCLNLDDEPFQLGLIDSNNLVTTDGNYFSSSSFTFDKNVNWVLGKEKNARIGLYVKKKIGEIFSYTSEHMYNSGFQYISGKGFSGDNGSPTQAKITSASNIIYHKSGAYCFYEPLTSKIRCVKNGVISTLAGNGAVGSDNKDLVLDGADFSKMSLPAINSLKFIGDYLYFVSARLIRKVKLNFSGPKITVDGKLEHVTQSIHKADIVCKKYTIPGLCDSLNTVYSPPNGVWPSNDFIAAVFDYYFEPGEPSVNPYFNNDTVYILLYNILYKYTISLNQLEPILGSGVSTLNDSYDPNSLLVKGAAPSANMELEGAVGIARGPKNTLFIATHRISNNKGDHAVIMLDLDGSQLGTSPGTPYAKYVFQAGEVAWHSIKYDRTTNTLALGLHGFDGPNNTVAYNRGIIRDFDKITELPLSQKLASCNNCRYKLNNITHLETDFDIKSIDPVTTEINLISISNENTQIYEHKLLPSNPIINDNIVDVQNFTVLAGIPPELSISKTNEKKQNEVQLDRPGKLALSDSNELFFTDASGQEIKTLGINGKIRTFYGIAEHNSLPATTKKLSYHNAMQSILSFRKQDKSIVYALPARYSSLFKKQASSSLTQAPEVLIENINSELSTTESINNTYLNSTPAPVFGNIRSNSSISESGTLYLWDKHRRDSTPISSYLRLYKLKPTCSSTNTPPSCNDSEAKIEKLAGKSTEVTGWYTLIPSNNSLLDTTLGSRSNFYIDSDERLYISSLSNVIYRSSIDQLNIDKTINVPHGTIIDFAIHGTGKTGETPKTLFILLSRNDAESREDVFDTEPKKQKNLFKHYLFAAYLKKDNLETDTPNFTLLTDFGDSNLLDPSDLIVDKDRNVIISESGANRILKYFVDHTKIQ